MSSLPMYNGAGGYCVDKQPVCPTAARTKCIWHTSAGLSITTLHHHMHTYTYTYTYTKKLTDKSATYFYKNFFCTCTVHIAARARA